MGKVVGEAGKHCTFVLLYEKQLDICERTIGDFIAWVSHHAGKATV